MLVEEREKLKMKSLKYIICVKFIVIFHASNCEGNLSNIVFQIMKINNMCM